MAEKQSEENIITRKVGVFKDAGAALFGPFDENVRLIEEMLDVRVSVSDGEINIRGGAHDVTCAAELFDKLLLLVKDGTEITRQKVRQSLALVTEGASEDIINLERDIVAVTSRGKKIKCKTPGQRDYVKSIKKNTIVFGIGPAGTGKTYLAVALAVAAYRRGDAEKIILTRPAIEAGEKLGFLPGDLAMKVDPYLRPLYDGLSEMLGSENYLKLIERGVIEIAPLAYMRGRTLNNAFIILDEAQNTTGEQMKMFLTRLGENSRMIINGDDTQVDLPHGVTSGLKNAAKILDGIDGIGICNLTARDIVRHELVQKIVTAYGQASQAPVPQRNSTAKNFKD